jgi:hypothetical protein
MVSASGIGAADRGQHRETTEPSFAAGQHRPPIKMGRPLARTRLFRGRAGAATRQKNVIKKHFRKLLMRSPGSNY